MSADSIQIYLSLIYTTWPKFMYLFKNFSQTKSLRTLFFVSVPTWLWAPNITQIWFLMSFEARHLMARYTIYDQSKIETLIWNAKMFFDSINSGTDMVRFIFFFLHGYFYVGSLQISSWKNPAYLQKIEEQEI